MREDTEYFCGTLISMVTLINMLTLINMGNWFSSDITLTCGSGTKKVNDECVPDNDKFFDILQKNILRELGKRSSSKQECEYFGGEYGSPYSSTVDFHTGKTSVISGTCQIPDLEPEDRRIIQQGLCGRKVKSEAEFCKLNL